MLRLHDTGHPELNWAHDLIGRQVAHLARLVDDLLDVSRITRGLVELREEPVNLAEMADRAVEMAAPAIDGRGHELNLSLPRMPLRVDKADANGRRRTGRGIVDLHGQGGGTSGLGGVNEGGGEFFESRADFGHSFFRANRRAGDVIVGPSPMTRAKPSSSELVKVKDALTRERRIT